ncbi:hypothetical protein HPB48_018799 [Haemaphysalis longicornis]|uniref:Amino acid transporter n=1 Tax=Haemaphysalis longicornis TaxID=44386 RepID=A0A9J6GYU7_HAELO|nr:hypothetical protein HPB48_018799 [Haemaphysalis longicornis]
MDEGSRGESILVCPEEKNITCAETKENCVRATKHTFLHSLYGEDITLSRLKNSTLDALRKHNQASYAKRFHGKSKKSVKKPKTTPILFFSSLKGCHVSARSRSDQFISPATLSRECREANANTRGKLKRKVGLLSAIAVVITSIIGSSRFYLLYGRKPALPLDTLLPDSQPATEYAVAAIARADQARQVARSSLLSPQASQKARYDCRHKNLQFSRESLVLVWSPSHRVGLSEKNPSSPIMDLTVPSITRQMSRALCMAELGALLPASGGEYAYLCAAGDTLGRPGDLVAFMYAWGRILIADPMNSALQGLTFASYILRLAYPDCTPPYLVTSLVAVAFTRTNNLEGPYFSSEVSPGSLAVAYFAALMTMDGGTAICYLGEEIKNPSQTIPRALIIGVVVVNVLFLLTNVAYFIVLEPSTIAASDATALTFGIESWGTAGAVIIPVVASIATFGTLSSGFFSNSRLGFAAARKGHLPSVLSFISAKSSVP